MAEIYLKSLSELADLFGLDRGTVRRRLAGVNIEPAGTGKTGYPVYDFRQAAPWLVAHRGPRIDPATLTPKEALDYYRGQCERRRLEKIEGSLVDAADVEREMSDMCKMIISILSTLPDRMERDTDLRHDQIHYIENVINDIRSEIYKQLTVEPLAQTCAEVETC